MTNELDLEALRTKAKDLGVPVHPAQKAETIQANIDKFLMAEAGVPVADAPEATPDTAPAVTAESEAEELQRMKEEALALIPITVTSMDPLDTGIPSVTISVGNAKLGQISKVIPFGYKWYMPKILVDHMKEQQFVRHSMVPTGTGSERVNTQWIKKYAIQYHPMPTPEELAELAKAQAVGNELAK